jgi:hypothetical protein
MLDKEGNFDYWLSSSAEMNINTRLWIPFFFFFFFLFRFDQPPTIHSFKITTFFI